MKLTQFIPPGVADIHWDLYEMKNDMSSRIMNLFKGWGYKQVATPTFEYYDVFLASDAILDKSKLFKFINRKGEIMVLRPDMTVPVARMVSAVHKEENAQLKFSYAGNVYRDSAEQAGLRQEFSQAGIEYYGNAAPEADAEIIALAIQSLLAVGIPDFKIVLGQAGYFKGMLAGIPAEHQEGIRHLVEEKNFPGLEEALTKLHVPRECQKAILAIPYLIGDAARVAELAKRYLVNQEMREALENLQQVCAVLADFGYAQYIDVDLGLISNMEYYTGIMFKGYISGYGKEVLAGGRYDNLSMAYGRQIPASGFSLNIDELADILYPTQRAAYLSHVSDYLVLYREKRAQAYAYSETLRQKGYIVECLPDTAENRSYARISKVKQVVEFEKEVTGI